jgi:hypothetical protein
LKVLIGLFISLFVFSSIFLVGCTNSKSVKATTKSLNESIQGHWKDKSGTDYYISNEKVVLKDKEGKIQHFTYFITVVNSDINLVEIMLKTPNGDIGAIFKIKFTDKQRKTADITTSKGGIGAGAKSVWSYADDKMNP